MLSAAFARQLTVAGLVTYDGAGPTGALPCVLEDMPSTPDNVVCVYTVSSFPREFPNIPYETPELQVIVRHTGTESAGRARPGFELCDKIRRNFDAYYDNTVWAAGTPDEVEVLWCNASASGPVPLGPDATGRLRWSVSFQLETLITEATP